MGKRPIQHPNVTPVLTLLNRTLETPVFFMEGGLQQPHHHQPKAYPHTTTYAAPTTPMARRITPIQVDQPPVDAHVAFSGVEPPLDVGPAPDQGDAKAAHPTLGAGRRMYVDIQDAWQIKMKQVRACVWRGVVWGTDCEQTKQHGLCWSWSTYLCAAATAVLRVMCRPQQQHASLSYRHNKLSLRVCAATAWLHNRC